MSDNESRAKQIFRTLLLVFLIEVAAILIGIGIAYYHVNRYGAQLFEPQPTFGEIIKMGVEIPPSLMALTFGRPWLLLIISVALIVLGLYEGDFVSCHYSDSVLAIHGMGLLEYRPSSIGAFLRLVKYIIPVLRFTSRSVDPKTVETVRRF
ncbi:MAG TPA: hypothetical protein VGN86_00240 [Pyrinomonadaceae bacterium]|jgi:hypothetical protein|nr:hypothetical protein [Pyrinomonadaceae bacterium]